MKVAHSLLSFRGMKFKTLSARCATRGATFLELVFAFAILTVFSAVAFAGFSQFNRFAASSRLNAQALTLAQQRVEEIMTAPWQTDGARPAILAVGTTTETALSLNTDAANAQSGLNSEFTSRVGETEAIRETVVTDLTSRSLRVTVTVRYAFGGRPYSVTLTTLRVTDNF